MDISIYALEKKIAEHEENIANASKQLKDLDAGKIELSPLKLASVENTLERSQNELAKYKEIYDAISEEEKEKFRNLQRVQEALAKQSYYKLQKIRIRRSLNIKRNQKLEAMMVIDELPEDVHFEDDQLIEIASVIIKYNMREVADLESLLIEIKDDFEKQREAFKDGEDLKTFHFLDTYIPIIILYFNLFQDDLQKSIEKQNEKKRREIEALPDDKKIEFSPVEYNGLPKYQDWWIEELYKNHQAYFALFRWKETIENLCTDDHQKVIWDKVFNAWLSIKKILNNKEENGFDYTYLFDTLLAKYAMLEEDLDMESLETTDNAVSQMMKTIDLNSTNEKHSYSTAYLQYKKIKQKD